MDAIEESFQTAAQEVESLRFITYDQALKAWSQLTACDPNATLYHRPSWVQVLQRAYGFRVRIAALQRDGEIVAGCLLASTRLPFFPRLVGLPFSDFCAPLGLDDCARDELMRDLAEKRGIYSSLEIRGVSAPTPWRTINCFEVWTLDLRCPFSEVQRRADRNFRRQVTRAAAEGFRVEAGNSEEFLSRFYRLNLQTRRRLGVPPQPKRFFIAVQKSFARSGDLEVWLVSRDSQDLAGVVLLRDGPCLYAKWSARAPSGSSGASHLVFFSLLEEHAGRAHTLDLGRTDVRNVGLKRFKSEMGATAAPLTYSYFPRAPRQPSAEAPEGAAGALSQVWRRLPLPITRFIGATIYPFLA